jgi:hypothetical protein
MHVNEGRDTNWQNAVTVALSLRQHLSRRVGNNVAPFFTSSKASIARTICRIRAGLLIARFLPAYVAFATLKHMVPLQRLVRLAWRPPADRRDHEAERRLVASVLRLSEFVGLRDRDCLQRSLLVYRLLSRAGAEPLLVIGFRRKDGRLLGHTWVIVDDRAIFESEADLITFSPAISFGSQGALRLSDSIAA